MSENVAEFLYIFVWDDLFPWKDVSSTTLLCWINTKTQSAWVLTWSYLRTGPREEVCGEADFRSVKFQLRDGFQKIRTRNQVFRDVIWWRLRGMFLRIFAKSRFCTKLVVLLIALWLMEGMKLLPALIGHFEIPAVCIITSSKGNKNKSRNYQKKIRFLCRKFGAVPWLRLDTWEVGIVTGTLGGTHIRVRPTQNPC